MHQPKAPWYSHAVGQVLADTEVRIISDCLPKLFGYHLVYIGHTALSTCINASVIKHRVCIFSHIAPEILGTVMVSTPTALPLASDSVDVIILSHVLEEAEHPHQILREAYRVLRPEGQLIITGFNPFSTLGLWRILYPAVRLLTPARLKDWLALLDFQVNDYKPFFFRPPIKNPDIMDKLDFLEAYGPKWFPFCSGAYMLTGVKRVLTLTALRPAWRLKKEAVVWVPDPTPTIRSNSTNPNAHFNKEKNI